VEFRVKTHHLVKQLLAVIPDLFQQVSQGFVYFFLEFFVQFGLFFHGLEFS